MSSRARLNLEFVKEKDVTSPKFTEQELQATTS